MPSKYAMIAVVLALHIDGQASEASAGLLTDWTGRAAVLFEGKVPEHVWSIQGNDRVVDGRRIQDVLVLTAPRAATIRSCKSEAIRVLLQQGHGLERALVCRVEPCEQTRAEYAAVRRPGESAPCSQIGVERYFLLATPIEEQAAVEAYDLAECIRSNGMAVVSRSACGFSAHGEISAHEQKLLDELVDLRLVGIGIERFRKRGRFAYAFSYSDSKDFLRPHGTVVWLTFAAPAKAEIGAAHFVPEY